MQEYLFRNSVMFKFAKGGLPSCQKLFLFKAVQLKWLLNYQIFRTFASLGCQKLVIVNIINKAHLQQQRENL